MLKEYFTTAKEIRPVKVEEQVQRAKTTEFVAFVKAEIAHEVALRERGTNQG